MYSVKEGTGSVCHLSAELNCCWSTNAEKQSFCADVLQVRCILQSTLVGKVKLLLTLPFVKWTKWVVIVEICWHVNLDATTPVRNWMGEICSCHDMMKCSIHRRQSKDVLFLNLLNTRTFLLINAFIFTCWRICAQSYGMLTNVDLYFEGEKGGYACNVRWYLPPRRAQRQSSTLSRKNLHDLEGGKMLLKEE